MKPMKVKKFPDILSRFRDEVEQFSEKFGGVKHPKKNFKAPLTRKEKRKWERQLKHAKNLAHRRGEKAPNLDNFISSKKPNKKGKVEKKQEPKPNQNKNEKKNDDKKEVQTNSVELLENTLKNEENVKKNYEKSSKKNVKRKLIEDNEREDKEIRKLEKLLHIKKDSKKYKKAFYDEGMDDLLDFCDEEKRKEMIKNEANLWINTGEEKEETPESKEKKAKIEKLNKDLKKRNGSKDQESDNSSQSDISDMEDDDEGQDDEGFFKTPSKNENKKKVHFEEENNSSEESEEDSGGDNEDEESGDDEFDEEDENENSIEDEGDDIGEDDEVGSEDFDSDMNSEESDQESNGKSKSSKKKSKDDSKDNGLKEDIYGRFVDKSGNVVKTEKYVPPAQRLKQLLESSTSEQSAKVIKLNKILNGLLNRLSTANMHSIINQITQMFYSNEYSRFDLIETLNNLFTSSLINSLTLTPIRLLIEHAALISILSSNIGVELGANLLQKFCNRLNTELNTDESYNIENKSLDNILLFICNLYHFKLFSSSLLNDLLSDYLIENLDESKSKETNKIEKTVDLILLILRSVGFSLRKDDPVALKDIIIKLQSKINTLKSKLEKENSESLNNRLKFMLESINAIKNNDIRRLDSFDFQPIEQIRKQMKVMLKEEKNQTQLNISYKDLVNAKDLGRWWIVGSAWSLKEDQDESQNEQSSNDKESKSKNGSDGEVFSEKILKLAKAQHMNTDIRKTVFCIILSAEDYTDAFMKLIKLSLKKQQEREIIYVIAHCALNEKLYNPYYSFLLQKFCEYDRRFKFHTWDKFKMFPSMTKQQITNFSSLYTHLIGTGAMSLSVLKNAEFGEMNKYLLQFLRELFTNLFDKYNDLQVQEIFMKIATYKKLYQLRNALKLFIVHFMLTDKGKTINVDEKLKHKCDLAQKVLSINTD